MKQKADSKYTVGYSIQHMWIYYYLFFFYSDLKNFHNNWLTIFCLQKMGGKTAVIAQALKHWAMVLIRHIEFKSGLQHFPDSQAFAVISKLSLKILSIL